MTTKRFWTTVLIALGLGLILVTDYPIFNVIIAVAVSYVFLRVAFMVLGALGRPVPDPPPAGELRSVRLKFRCSICGTEVRMTSANDEVPEPPRHCLEDMDLVAPTFE